jgi:hypothetical protein
MRLGSSESGPMREGENGKAKSIFDFELGEYRGQVVPPSCATLHYTG